LRKFLLLAICAFILFAISLYSIAPRIIISTNLPFYHIVKGKSKPKTISQIKNFDLAFKEIKIESEQGYPITANLIYTNNANAKGTIIMLHGIRASKEHFIPISKTVTVWGYNALIVDLKAHGQSGGDYCTFGYNEKNDISDLITYVIETEDEPTSFGIWGQSLGGAVALQTLAIDERIAFGIIESTFAELRPTVHRYAKNYTGFNWPALTNFMINRMESIADFKVDDIKPYEIAKQIKQPVLMVHGKKDKKMPIAVGEKIFNSLNNEQSEFYIIDEANHLNVWKVGGLSYMNKVSDYLEMLLNNGK